MHEKFLISSPSWGEITHSRGDFRRDLQSLESIILKFTDHCIGKALCDVKTADAVSFVDDMDISRHLRLGYLADLRRF